MRILHIARSLNVAAGGPAQSVPALCRSLVGLGAHVALYSFCKPGDQIAVSAGEPFTVRWFGYTWGMRLWPSPEYSAVLDAEVRNFAVVHLNGLWHPAMTIAATACRKARVPYVITPRGMLQTTALSHKRPRKRLYYALWERRTIAGARVLHFFTEAERADSAGFLDSNSCTVVIPNGIDVSLQGTAAGRFRAAHPQLRDRRIMLFLGRVHWSKNLDLQLEALRLLAPEFPDLMWVIIGPDEGERRKLDSKIRAYGLAEKVLWTDTLPWEQCLEALADADVFVLTSRHEAHSVAMNEALAMGIPLVITQAVSFHEVAACGAGSVVACDPQQVAAAVAGVLRDPVQAASMRQAARQFACEHLAWPKIAAEMLNVYKTITSANP